MFDSLSDRLQSALAGLRGKGKLTEADINATTREIRLALLEADVSLTVVRGFIKRIKERARGAEVSEALNPAQQVVKIVNDELVATLGGAGDDGNRARRREGRRAGPRGADQADSRIMATPPIIWMVCECLRAHEIVRIARAEPSATRRNGRPRPR